MKAPVTEPIPDDDLYRRLKITPDAPTGTILAAHRALIRRSHPDLCASQQAEEQSKRLNIARDWLADPGRRARYDRSRRAAVAPGVVSRQPATPPPRRAVPIGAESAASELRAFVTRCGSLGESKMDRIVAEYRSLEKSDGRFAEAIAQLVQFAIDVGRQRMAVAASYDAMAAAGIEDQSFGPSHVDAFRWAAFAIAVADLAPVEASYVLRPWNASVEAAGFPPSRRTGRRAISLIALGATGIMLVLGPDTAAATAIGAGVSWWVLVRVRLPTVR
jgi:curved DNA-binding protein CbpA